MLCFHAPSASSDEYVLGACSEMRSVSLVIHTGWPAAQRLLQEIARSILWAYAVVRRAGERVRLA